MESDELKEIKEGYEEKIAELNAEINALKGELFSMKIERDHYQSDYNIIKKEKEILFKELSEANDKGMNGKYFYEQNLKKVQSHFEDKIKLLSVRNDQLEKENVELNLKCQQLQEDLEKKDDTLLKLMQNNENINKEVAEIQQKEDEYKLENEQLKGELNKVTKDYEFWQDNSNLRIYGRVPNSYEDIILQRIERIMKSQDDKMKEVTEVMNRYKDNDEEDS